MRANGDLETPWLREELLERLVEMSDSRWMQSAVDKAGRPGEPLNQTLDFFDDTGVLDQPTGRIGSMLRTTAEAEALAALGLALRRALEGPSAEQWEAVVKAAGTALAAVEREKPADPRSG